MEHYLRGSYCNSCNTAMTPNELAEVRERYSNEKFPGLDMPMDQVFDHFFLLMFKSPFLSDDKFVTFIISFTSDDRDDDEHGSNGCRRLRGDKKDRYGSLPA